MVTRIVDGNNANRLMLLESEDGGELVIARKSDQGVGTIDFGGGKSYSPADILGREPLDLPIMFYRSTGKGVNFSVPTPYSALDSSVTHGAFVYVPEGFNGYKYHLGYTPMPYYNSTYDDDLENPCYCASNDLVNWVVPEGTRNPIVDMPTESAGAFNSDTHLILSPDRSMLILIWRPRLLNDNTIMLATLARGSSAWSAPVEIWRGNIATDKRLMASPSLWYEPTTSKWVIMGHHADGVLYKVHRITSSSLLSGWDAVPSAVSFPLPVLGRQWWHSWFVRLASGRIVGFIQDNDGTSGGTGRVYAAQSTDAGVSFSAVMIDPGSTVTGDLYRPSGLFVERNGVSDVFLVKAYLRKPYFTLSKLSPVSLPSSKQADTQKVFQACSAAAAGFPGAAIAADDFNRSDNASSLGATLDGKTWTQIDANIAGISGNAAVGGSSGVSRATVNVGVADYSALLIVGEAGKSNALMIGFVDTNNYWVVGPLNGSLQITQIAAGAVVTATQKVLSASAAGDVIRVDVSGRSFRAYINGAFVYDGSGVLSAYATSVGFRTGGALTGKIDAFAVLPIDPPTS